MIANAILDALRRQDVELAVIKAELELIRQAVTEPGMSPDQTEVDALTAQATAAAAGLNLSTGDLEAAITQETQIP